MKRSHLVLLSVLVLAACGGDSTGPKGTPPVLSLLAPARGTVGTEVHLSGQGLNATGIEVFFGSLKSPRVVIENGELYALAPSGLVAGQTYDVRVSKSGLTSNILPAAFTAVPPDIARVNGATKATGLIGMTLIIEGDAFGDVPGPGKVYFADASGARIPATIADSLNDWTNGFVVTTVPQGTAAQSKIWIETATGVSDSVEFRLISSGVFSPSTINWTRTTLLPQPLQALGAVFVPVEDGSTPANYVFTVGGADSLMAATPVVYRARVQPSGALDSWSPMTPLPVALAYQATVAATPFTAPIDTTSSAVLYALGGRDAAGKTVNTVYYARVDLAGQVGAWLSSTALPAPLHSAGAAIFRGYVYLAGGADSANVAKSAMYRAKINPDGSLATWESLPALSAPHSYFSLVNFGPYLYTVGGETGTSTPTRATQTGTETSQAQIARINLRTGLLTTAGWSAVSSQSKARSKHSTVFAGGALFTTSGVYAGQAGSSENTYASVSSDGTLASWNGATGSETIDVELGYSLYNQAAITFVDQSGAAHVLVLGGANRALEGKASAAVVYY
jgi:IPT/TIG domain-containing protein